MKWFYLFIARLKLIVLRYRRKRALGLYEDSRKIIEKRKNISIIFESARLENDPVMKTKKIQELVEIECAKELVKVVENESTYFNDLRIEDDKIELALDTLLKELKFFKTKRVLVQIRNNDNYEILEPDFTQIDNYLEEMIASIVSTNKVRQTFDKSSFPLAFPSKSILNAYKAREDEKRKQLKIRSSLINRKIKEATHFVQQERIQDAKRLCRELNELIDKNQKQFMTKYQLLVEQVSEVECTIEKRIQEIKRKEREKEKARLKEEQLKEALRIEAAKQEEIELERKKLKEGKQKKSRLEALLSRKSDWREYQKLLQRHNVKEFYHFTDKSNLESIVSNGGLYSWYYSDSNGIEIHLPGGDNLSRELDATYGLEDYVRASFCKSHPMKYRLEKVGREVVVLKLSLEIAYFKSTLFSDRNATDSDHQKGGDIEDLAKVDFNATRMNYLRKSDPNFKKHQAEVMVKTWIPLDYIQNLTEFVT